MSFLKEIWATIKRNIISSNHQNELEQYIMSKYPKNSNDVEQLTTEFYYKRNRGIL
jgi:hypothetical protein